MTTRDELMVHEEWIKDQDRNRMRVRLWRGASGPEILIDVDIDGHGEGEVFVPDLATVKQLRDQLDVAIAAVEGQDA